MTDDTIRDLEDFPSEEEEENEHLGKPADVPLEGIQNLLKRCAVLHTFRVLPKPGCHQGLQGQLSQNQARWSACLCALQ